MRRKFFLTARTSEIADIGKAPTSCWDLQRMGHKLNGFFSVKGRKNIRMVYCDFNATNQQGMSNMSLRFKIFLFSNSYIYSR